MTQTKIEIEDDDGNTHTIKTDSTADNGLQHTEYTRYNEEIGIYIQISYKNQGGNVLDYTIHGIGTDWDVLPVGAENYRLGKIKKETHEELNIDIDEDTALSLAKLHSGVSAEIVGGKIEQNNLDIDEVARLTSSDGRIDYGTLTAYQDQWEDAAPLLNMELDVDINDVVPAEHVSNPDPVGVMLRILDDACPRNTQNTEWCARLEFMGVPTAEQLNELKNLQ